MARNFDGVDDYIALELSATSAVTYAAYDLFLWFRTSATGTTLKCLYSENDSTCRITINDGASGRIRFTRNTPITMTAAGPYNDGSWHLVRVKQVSASERYLYIDDMDTPVASDTTTGSVGATSAKRLGATTGGASFYSGDLGDLMIWEGNLTDADAQELSDRTKHPGQITSGTELRSWVSNGTNLTGLNTAREGSGTQTASSGTTLVNGPHGEVGPIGLTEATDRKNAWVYDPIPTPLFTADSGKEFREPGNLVDRGEGADPRWVFYLSEYTPPYTSNALLIAYSSNDLSTWTKVSNNITDNADAAEDPFVVKDTDGTYWMMSERGGVRIYSSSDGLSFTTYGDLTITGIPVGQTPASPTFWRESDGTWHMLYEALSSETIRYASAPAVTGPWTDGGLMIDVVASTITAGQAVPDDIVKIGSDYFLEFHGLNSTGKPGVWTAPAADGPWTLYRGLGLPDGCYLDLRWADNVQGWQPSGDFSKLIGMREANQTAELIQLWGDPAEQTEVWPLNGVAAGLTAGTLSETSQTNSSVTVSWTAATNNTGTVSDQLQRSDDGSTGWTAVSGATSSPATVNEMPIFLRVAYTDDVETVYSDVLEVTDTTDPVVLSLRITGDILRVVFSEAVSGDLSQLALTASGGALTITGDDTLTAQSSIDVQVSRTPATDETITATLSEPSGITDAATNEMAGFTDEPVTIGGGGFDSDGTVYTDAVFSPLVFTRDVFPEGVFD